MPDYGHGSYVDVFLLSPDIQCRRKVRMRLIRNDSYTRFPAKLLKGMGWSEAGYVAATKNPPPFLTVHPRDGAGRSHYGDRRRDGS